MTCPSIGKVITLLSAGFFFTSLNGCKPHENILLKIKNQRVAEFLVKAANAAEKEVKLPGAKKGEAPFYYKECMKGNKDKAVCKKLYESMVKYAKTTDRFKSVTVEDLSSDDFFDEIEDDYNRALTLMLFW